jgi:serine/threonine-protein kinase
LAILIHTGQPKPLAEHRPDLPPGLAALVHGAMATDRGQRMQSAGELRNMLEHYGPVGFRSQIRNSPLPPPSIVPARALSTSAAGVSLRPAALAAKPPKPALLVAAALGLGAAAALGGGLWWLTSHSAANEVASAAPSPAPLTGVASVALPVVREPAPSVSVPPASAAPSVAAALADSAPIPGPAVSAARSPQSGLGSAAPRVAPPRPGRADERGLAKDNPFK